MLLNLSNHPSSSWPANQIDAAMQAYGGVTDLTFPAIDPNSSLKDVTVIADTYLEKIQQMGTRITAVHLMGELTFTYVLCNKLAALSILCVASTTQRNTLDLGDGRKQVAFQFVQFRPYF